MSQIKSGFGHVYTSRVQNSINVGKGVFDPNKIKWVEDSSGKVFVGGSRVRVIGNGKTVIVPPEPPTPPIPEDEVKIGNLIWKTSYLDVEPTGDSYYYKEPTTGLHYYKCDPNTVAELKTLLPEGWRIPTADDFNALSNSAGSTTSERFDALASTTTWTNGGGNNTTGFDLEANGCCWYAIDYKAYEGVKAVLLGEGGDLDLGGFVIHYSLSTFGITKDGELFSVGTSYNNGSTSTSGSSAYWYLIRLCKDA